MRPTTVACGSRWLFKPRCPPGFWLCPGDGTGAYLWSPAATADLVYIGGYDGKIYAISTSKGSLEWTHPREGHLPGHRRGGRRQ